MTELGAPNAKASQAPVRNQLVLSTVLASVLVALVFVSTYVFFVPIPATRGIFNFGDIMIFIIAFTFGPILGGLAGGMGSALADIVAAPIYAPYTLVIKGAEGWVAGYLSRGGTKSRNLVAWLCAGLTMMGGYFITQTFFIAGVVAIAEVPFNFLQVSAGGLVGIPVSTMLKRRLPAILKGMYPTPHGAAKIS